MKNIGILGLMALIFASCNDFLEIKPDRSIVIPETVADIRAMLDHQFAVNEKYPGLIEMVADDYFLEAQELSTRAMIDQNIYLWDSGPDVFHMRSWAGAYGTVMVANVALESIEKIRTASNTRELDQLMGEAYFIRGNMFYALAQLYTAPYDPAGNNAGLGIPLRVSSDMDVPSQRSTIEETYVAILHDLNRAVELLPDRSEAFTRPSVTAAYAALSRVHLTMGAYALARSAADEALAKKSDLLDYNTLIATDALPFDLTNPEIIYYAHTVEAGTLITKNLANVDTVLYSLFDEHDLRKGLFFEAKQNAYHAFKGQYTGNEFNLFTGIATDELFLTRAECLARENEIENALVDLNTLLSKRYQTNAFVPVRLTDQTELLDLIILERRKQLMFRGIRWADIRRLNFQERYKQTLQRVVKGEETKVYELPPGDLRFSQLIPQAVIEQSGMEQNPR